MLCCVVQRCCVLNLYCVVLIAVPCVVLCCFVLCCLLYLDVLYCVVSCRAAFRCSIFTATVPIFQQSVWDNTSDIVLPETLPSEALLFLEQSLDGVDELFEIPFD